MNESLSKHSPHLLDEWDYDLNVDIDPEKISFKSQKKVTWICPKNPKHKWASRIRSRSIAGTGCLYCLGKMTLREESFAEKKPDLLIEWDWGNNEKLAIDPWQITTFSNKRVNWICKKNPEHKWMAAIFSRAEYGTGCKKCNHTTKSKIQSKDKSLATNFPELLAEWDIEDNLPLTPDIITYGSAREVSWVCRIDSSHRWKSRVTNRTSTSRSGCPHCKGIITNKTNSLVALYPDIAEEWHPTKNQSLDINTIKKASGRKVWWVCSKDASHEWQAQVRNRTTVGSGCPDCDADDKSYRLHEYIYKQESFLSDHYKVFRAALKNVNKLIFLDKFSGHRQEQIFFRLIYSNLISILESYLSDAFSNLVLNNPSYLNKFFLSVRGFTDRKYSIQEAVNWHNNATKNASEYIHEIVWHNLPRVFHLYKNVLDIELPPDNGSLMKAISKRHDIVHRNGKNIKGKAFRVEKDDLEALSKTIENYVKNIDAKVAPIA